MKFKQSSICAIFCVLGGTLALVSCNHKSEQSNDTGITSADGKHLYSDTGSSSVRVFDQNGRVCIQQSNTYYEVVNAYDNEQKVPLLLKIKKTELCYADSVNKTKVYEISAKSVMDSKPVNWQTKVVATNLEFKDNTVLATYEGTADTEDFMKRFSLLDGKEVFSCSYGDLRISIPNVKDRRFIGYTSQKAVTNPIKDLNQENLFGILRFGSSHADNGGVKIIMKRSKVTGKIPNSTPEMVFVAGNTNCTVFEDGKSLILMKADEHYQPADVKDFSVKLTFYIGDDNEASSISIPVSNDRLDLSKAQYDKDIFELTTL